ISNVDSTREKIIRTFDKINKLFKNDEAEFKKELLELKLQELELNYSYIVKVNDEKEQQKAIKEQMIEEEKVRREIEREKKRIDKEERQFNSEITKLMAYMQKASADVEKELYADKIKELEEKLRELETVKEDVLQRELNTRAGYVYVISNIGSFGEDVYKIGMTRRLEPMDRIKELSSASVPFEFDVHAMIFSEDAPTLENQLHSHFRKNEVNKVNQRKEFFKVSLDEIEKVVLENYNGTVSFTKLAQAEQYRRSLELTDV
ncbi:TPA: GIY-YIG nuclease family protein, partial [Enterococcus faecium]|nr:GIY-YIG nuclease family protein [Enterococcus faecium]HAQ2375851.1 GIY-YIG nuclease family protein [Enterococcus faecium]HBM7168918.1 GIY-YIG nuclease family protein [Enterococcus faecium]HCR9815974.1 GIY-YIG nuclease family protein [Enterococcus faecium]